MSSLQVLRCLSPTTYQKLQTKRPRSCVVSLWDALPILRLRSISSLLALLLLHDPKASLLTDPSSTTMTLTRPPFLVTALTASIQLRLTQEPERTLCAAFSLTMPLCPAESSISIHSAASFTMKMAPSLDQLASTLPLPVLPRESTCISLSALSTRPCTMVSSVTALSRSEESPSSATLQATSMVRRRTSLLTMTIRSCQTKRLTLLKRATMVRSSLSRRRTQRMLGPLPSSLVISIESRGPTISTSLSSKCKSLRSGRKVTRTCSSFSHSSMPERPSMSPTSTLACRSITTLWKTMLSPTG